MGVQVPPSTQPIFDVKGQVVESGDYDMARDTWLTEERSNVSDTACTECRTIRSITTTT